MNRPDIECAECAGHGWYAARDMSLGPGTYEKTCPACNGHGWREMTIDEEIDGMKKWNRQEFGL